MIDDIAVDDEFFDPDFFVYREDADVAWRAQLLGWRCIYTPHARGYHVRNVLPGNRRALPPVINMHSVKNRFLMRMKNITGDLYRRNWFSITVRDLVVISCCLVREQSSLKAFWYIARNWRRVMAKRRDIMSRKRVDDEYIAHWFRYRSGERAGQQAEVVGRGLWRDRRRRGASAGAGRRRKAARIAILGTRGIPARYGGFETFAEELSTRLVARGHRVTVYCRERYAGAAIAVFRWCICPPGATSISTPSFTRSFPPCI